MFSPMISLLHLLVCAVLLFTNSASSAQTNTAKEGACTIPCQQSLNGNWQFLPGQLAGSGQYIRSQRAPESDWKSIKVPANWFKEGFQVSGVGWYKREFSLPPNAHGLTTTLRFEGVDYFADVWINGQYIGAHEGYFAPFSFDISQALNHKGHNEIVVRVDSPIEEPAAWSLNKRLIKGIFSHHDTRPGGAWSVKGQDKNTGGIWNNVNLSFSRQMVLAPLRIRTALAQGGKTAMASLRVTAYSSATNAQDTQADIELQPENFAGPIHRETRILTFPAGQSDQTLTVLAPDAQTWWPAELGAARLYRLKLTVRKGATTLDAREAVFGFREVRLDETTSTWQINGKRLFLRGTNYIPTQWLSEMTLESYRKDVQLMQAAHVNAVRVHAHVGDPLFYQACDEAGLLVWQDFPLQWGYEDSSKFHAEAARQTSDMIAMLDNHPSVFAWSLHNEPPWDAWWMKYKYPNYDPNQNRKLDDDLYRVALKNDTTRYVHKYSATSEHQWQGWYSGNWTDFIKPTTHALVSEFGAQALPNINSLRRIFNEDNLYPNTPEKIEKWEYHNFQKDETFKNAKISMGKNIQEFINNSQGYQARLIQLAAESLRRQKYKPVGAIFQFMFVEDWPSMNWGVVDYWRHTKPGYAALQQAYQPILPSIEWSKESYQALDTPAFNLWIVNDTQDAWTGLSYEWVLLKDGQSADSGKLAAAVQADHATQIGKVLTKPLIAGAYRLQVRLRQENGSLIGDNNYEFLVN
jgi:beta-mannosidase